MAEFSLVLSQIPLLVFNEDAFIESCEKAIKRVESNRVNEEGLKLQKEFTYKRTTDDILDLLYDL